MNIKKSKKREMIKETEKVLMSLMRGDDPRLVVNLQYGLLGDKPFKATLTKQMTLDAYIEEESARPPSFPVLDVTVNIRAFGLGKMNYGLENQVHTPASMAVELHKAYKRLLM